MTVLSILVAILGLGLLMVVHEAGHHFVARAFGMRVIRFSIGFGPAIWRHRPRGSDTVYQVALIPFLAYVQIAGMNPFEEIEPDDEGSYANASLTARISTLAAGPLANYFFASVLFFGAFAIGGDRVPTTTVKIVDDGPAAAAKMQDEDTIVRIEGKPIESFDDIRDAVTVRPKQPTRITVRRQGRDHTLVVTPDAKGPDGKGRIGVESVPKTVPITLGEAARRSVIAPAVVVQQQVILLGRVILRKVDADLAGPVGIVKMAGSAARRGLDTYLELLAMLSAILGLFNLLPFPALDGGRLVFLGYELVTRRRANAELEAKIHYLGLAFLLAVMVVVSWFDAQRPMP